MNGGNFSLLEFINVVGGVALLIFLFTFVINMPHRLLWIGEVFVNLVKTQTLPDSVIDLSGQNASFIKNFVFDAKEFFLGTGKFVYWTNGELRYFGDRDSGYIREFLCVGVLFSTFLYALLTTYIMRWSKVMVPHFLKFFLLLCFFVLQIKGEILYFYLGLFFLLELCFYSRTPKEEKSPI